MIPCFYDQQLNDLKFCVEGDGILLEDITFNLWDMWVTDTAYQNKRLVNDEGEHPLLFGPLIFHHTKRREVFRRLALEMVAFMPLLPCMKYIGKQVIFYFVIRP